jgi:type II secretory pathway component GspD/PulD (secretin)
MPRIQRNGDVLLQYGVNIKELVGADDGFDERTIGNNTIQLKRMNQRNFIQNANIPHGQTLVLAGFEQVRSTTRNSGVGHPLFPLLGGGSSASKEREVIVIMITPTVLK